MDKMIKILFPVLILLFFACQPEDDRARRKKAIDKKIEERVANYIKIQKENCRKDLLEEASKIVDSILIVEARMRIDSSRRLPKPEKPTVMTPADSLEIAPFFKDSTLELIEGGKDKG